MKSFIALALVLTSTLSFAQTRRPNPEAIIAEIEADMIEAQNILKSSQAKLNALRGSMTRPSQPIVFTSSARPVISIQCNDMRGSTDRSGGSVNQQNSIRNVVNNVLAVCRTSGRNQGDCDERNVVLEFAQDSSDLLKCNTIGRIY
jgi:hypothetical protein